MAQQETRPPQERPIEAAAQQTAQGEAGGARTTGLGTTRYKEYDLPAYCQIVRARIPAEIWSGVLYSWLSYKGHLLALHDFDRSEFFATTYPDGDVDAIFVVVWEEAESLGEWLEHGYSVDHMLRKIGLTDDQIRVTLMRDFS